MRRALLILTLVGLLLGTSGCLGLSGEEVPGDGLQEDQEPGQDPEDDGADDQENGNETSEGQSDLSWSHTVLYDYVRDRGSAGMVSVDVPKEASEMTLTAEFQYWPPVASAPGICSSDTELVIEVEGPDGEPFLNNTFNEDLEEGTEGERCGQIESRYDDSPAHGEWKVSFNGEGIAVGEVSFQGS